MDTIERKRVSVSACLSATNPCLSIQRFTHMRTCGAVPLCGANGLYDVLELARSSFRTHAQVTLGVRASHSLGRGRGHTD